MPYQVGDRVEFQWPLMRPSPKMGRIEAESVEMSATVASVHDDDLYTVEPDDWEFPSVTLPDEMLRPKLRSR